MRKQYALGRLAPFILSLSLIFHTAACGEGSGFSSDQKSQGAEISTSANGEALPGSSATNPSAGNSERPPSDAFPDESQNSGSSPASGKIYDPGKPGPYQVQSYSDANLTSAAYQSAQVYYPIDAPLMQTLPGSSLSGGFTNTKEDMAWLGQHLASHGFIVLAFTPTNNRSLDPNIWATGHKGSLEVLKAESQREGSPIKGRLKADKLGIMGFSMGGAGTILAVNQLGSSAVQAAVPICAFQPQLPTAQVPTMLLTGTSDNIAVPANIISAYTNMNTGAPKALANFNGMTHLDVVQTGLAAQHENIARFATSWYLVHLSAQAGYKTYLDGEENKKMRADMGVFAFETDFSYQP